MALLHRTTAVVAGLYSGPNPAEYYSERVVMKDN
jgi:hypothetical protein